MSHSDFKKAIIAAGIGAVLVFAAVISYAVYVESGKPKRGEGMTPQDYLVSEMNRCGWSVRLGTLSTESSPRGVLFHGICHSKTGKHYAFKAVINGNAGGLFIDNFAMVCVPERFLNMAAIEK